MITGACPGSRGDTNLWSSSVITFREARIDRLVVREQPHQCSVVSRIRLDGRSDPGHLASRVAEGPVESRPYCGSNGRSKC